MSKKSLSILIILVALVAGAAGFYYGKVFTLKTVDKTATIEWHPYTSKEGLQMKYPSTLTPNDTSAPVSEFMESSDHRAEIPSFIFADRLHKAGEKPRYPLVYFVVFPNEEKVAFDDWVATYQKFVTPPSDKAPAGTVLPPEKITLAGREGTIIRLATYEGEAYKTNVFLPLKHNKILVGVVLNNVDYEPAFKPMTKESENFLFSILATMDDTNLSWYTAPTEANN